MRPTTSSAAPIGCLIPSGEALMAGAEWVDGLRLGRNAGVVHCAVAQEVPVGLLFNSVAYAVLVCSPVQLDDLAVGFWVTERLGGERDVVAVVRRTTKAGIELDIELTPAALRGFLATRQARSLRSYSSCGVCGTTSLALLPGAAAVLPKSEQPVSMTAIRRALTELHGHQALNRATGATHAAAWAGVDGSIVLVREDVGRHNALDKLIGARARQRPATAGFCVLTSRCSFEMVQKAAAGGIGVLVAISAPTSLAIRTAQDAGIALVALAREDSQIVYTGAERLVCD